MQKRGRKKKVKVKGIKSVQSEVDNDGEEGKGREKEEKYKKKVETWIKGCREKHKRCGEEANKVQEVHERVRTKAVERRRHRKAKKKKIRGKKDADKERE